MTQWVFLRGLMRESRHWGDFPEQFMRQLGGCEILLPDLAGNGGRYREASPCHVAGMVEHYRDVLAGSASSPPYRVLALSLGAMIATAWAHCYPGEVDAMVLINTSLRPFSPFYRRLHWRSYPAVLEIARRRGDALACEQQILRLTSNRDYAHAGLAQRWAGYRNEFPVSARNALCQLLAAAAYRAPQHRPPVPTMLLASSGDRLVHPQCSHRLAKAWESALALHPWAGHDLPLDDGKWVATQVAAWTSKTGRKKA